MKKTLTVIIVLFIAVTSCNKPKTIPDRELPNVIRDMIIANAYSATKVPNIGSDTIDIYTPILARYGYTDADLRHTLNSMAMKKSSRLSEIVDSVIADIGRQNDYLKGRKAVRDKIDSLVRAKYVDSVYVMDTVPIIINGIAESDIDKKYTIKVPTIRGDYSLKLNYIIDTSDKRNLYLLRYYTETDEGKQNRPGALSYSRSGMKKMSHSATISTGDTDTALVIKLVNYNRSFSKPVDLTLDSIYILYHLPIEEGRLRMAKEMMNFSLRNYFDDELSKKDSGALYVVPPLRPDTTGRADFQQ